ncbi:MAG: 4-hydroxythreonine-4-phosphate dehydrogenase PdxA, partial [Hyphomicrobiaceae bacterium]|nr:4-hydroxythreonine-4-phosphate dehydrogenase PdxA [Hyphomicrobiaceae bacterium]
MTTRTDVPLALTMGDPAGIGPELAIAIWCHRHTNRCPAFALLADPDLIKARAADVGLIAPVALIATASEAAAVFDAALPVLPIPLSTTSVAGKPDPANATAVIRAIDQAVSAVANGQASAVVTNPIAKSVLYAAGFSHPGHTEYLAELTRRHWPEQPATPVMMLASSELKVVPLTIHVPLHTVPTLITPDLIMHTVRIMHHALQSDFGYDRPR